MRYPDGGGLTPAARARREQVRLEAAGLFAPGVRPSQVAKQLRVSRKSAYAWHKAWSLAGTEALLSKGPDGQSCRLSDGQMQRLEAASDAVPAAYGWSEDQRWTLARVALQVGRAVPRVLHATRDLLSAASTRLEPAGAASARG
jgi:transposase